MAWTHGIEFVFDSVYVQGMSAEPAEPQVRHVWVRGQNDYAPVIPAW
jgi:hypothetical protein